MSPGRRPRPGPWTVVLGVVLVAFAAVTVLRFARGLGAVSNLSDDFPWGVWVGFNLLCAVGLAAGAFTLTAIVHIFNLERFEPIVRPTVLTGFVGYLCAVGSLVFELGQPWRIWYTIVFWNPHSVLFEVAWCVMLYTTVLAVEFSPVVLERFGWVRAQRAVKAVAVPLVIAGVILSTLHQSSLGSLFLIVPSKLHPLWYTPLLPVFFFLSAIGAGIGMTILESAFSERVFGRRLEIDLLERLARGMVVALGVYGMLRVVGLWRSDALSGLARPGYEEWMFLVEFGLGVVAPVGLLLVERVRTSRRGLIAGAWCAVLGLVMNRMNVSVTGLESAVGGVYVPSVLEMIASLGLVAMGVVLFTLAVRHLPVFPVTPLRARSGAAAG